MSKLTDQLILICDETIAITKLQNDIQLIQLQ